jgi:hypothetical protein
MKAALKTLFVLTCLSTLAACGYTSPEEKEQRRANAFDISGVYTLSSAASRSTNSTTMEIVNESDRSDVYGVVSRGAFTASEEAAFSRQNISLNDVEKFRTKFKFGAGKHEIFTGGENISDDMGASSHVFISTNSQEGLTLGEITISYSMSGTVTKSDFTLNGSLIMTITKTETTNNSVSITTLERIEMPFSAKCAGLFSNQYMGSWEGKMTSDDQNITSALNILILSKNNEETYRITPKSSTFIFAGEVFTYNSKSLSTDSLALVDFPEVDVEFMGNKGSKIELMGNIYSLGSLTGVISKIDSAKNIEQIGNFQLKRK